MNRKQRKKAFFARQYRASHKQFSMKEMVGRMSTKSRKNEPESVRKVREARDLEFKAPTLFIVVFSGQSLEQIDNSDKSRREAGPILMELPVFMDEDGQKYFGRHICGYGQNYEEAKKDFWETWSRNFPNVFLEFEEDWKWIHFSTVMEREKQSEESDEEVYTYHG